MRASGTRWLALSAVGSLLAAACAGGGGGTAAPSAPAGGGGGGGSPAASAPGGGDGSPAPSAPGSAPASDPAPTGEIGGTVSVIGTWGGDEEQSFLAMVEPFETETGIDVQYTGTRDLEAVLTTGTASGILPDLAGLPGPGQMTQFARDGHLVDLSTVIDQAAYTESTAPAFVELGTVDDMLAGVFIKSAVKGLIWYNTGVFDAEPPATWEDLQAIAAEPAQQPWCVALESGPDSGWPATDWIEDIVLRQSGPEVYDQWVAGELAWTSPEIRSAFETFGEVLENSFGGADFAINTNFGQGGNPLFTDPPGCLFHHQASFITDFFANEAGATPEQYDFFPFPDIDPEYAGALTGAGDLFGMFNDTPQSRALMEYLVTAEAQQIWVDRGGALSANIEVTEYPDEIAERSAAALREAEIFRFDGGDQMPGQMNSAFFAAMVQFTQNPGDLDSILASLDETQAAAYGTE